MKNNSHDAEYIRLASGKKRYGGFRIIDKKIEIKGMRFGYTADVLGREECPYMRRHILWIGIGTLRLHKFLRSDNDEVLHDHPWWFITLPFGSYQEWVPSGNCGCGGRIEDWEYGGCCEQYGDVPMLKTVKRLRFHFRSSKYRHAVVVSKPTWTFVISGGKSRNWGFWEDGERFTPWRQWFSERPLPPCVDSEEKE